MDSVDCTCPICGSKLGGNDRFCCDRTCPACGHVLIPEFDVDEFVNCRVEG